MKTWKETAIELQRELDALRQTVQTSSELEHLRQLRRAILWWPERTHEQWCATRADVGCNCGWAAANEARRMARELVGLNRDG